MTSPPDKKIRTVSQLWSALGKSQYGEDFHMGHSVHPSGERMEKVHKRRMKNIPSISDIPSFRLPEKGKENNATDLELKELIAEGGMGRVLIAHQAHLDRDVVVKMAQPELASKDVELNKHIFQESRLTGRLEHPNIVPVYQLGVDGNKNPMLVMRHIAGLAWFDLMSSTDNWPKAFDTGESLLERNIRVLMQVCNGISFAHSKGILHRDIKPENVMIGDYGEVYVLDWGLSVSMLESDRGKLPLAKEALQPAGTLAYMAPEMLLIEPDEYDQRTDLFLLGAILFEIITGKPPNRGQTIYQAIYHATNTERPPYPDHIPRELIHITEKATALKREDRYDTVEEFRDALQNVLSHRDSERLARKSTQHLQDFISLLEKDRLNDVDDKREDRSIRRSFNRSHFGFQHALSLWKENPVALEGMQKLISHMAEYELEQGDQKAANLLMEELDFTPPHLKIKLDVLERQQLAQSQQLAQLKQLAFDVDLSIGAKYRRFAAIFVCLIWSTLPLVGYTLEREGLFTVSNYHFLLGNIFFVMFLGVFTFIGRDQLLKNQANRQIVMLLFLLVGISIFQRIVVYLLDISFQQSLILEYIIFSYFVGTLAIMFNPKMIYAALLYLVALCLSLFYPEKLFIFLATAHLLVLSVVATYSAPRRLSFQDNDFI